MNPRSTFHAMMLGLGSLGLGLAFGTSAAIAHAQPEPSTQPDVAPVMKPLVEMTGPEVVERYIAAAGGRDAWNAVETRRSTGLFVIPDIVEGTLRMDAKRPNSMRLVVELGGMGTTRQGYHDGVAWEISDMAGPRILEGKEAEALARQADFDLLLDVEKHYPEMTNEGIEEFDGERCLRLDVVAENGTEETWWFDVETGLQSGVKTTMVTQMGEIESVTKLRDYELVDGIKMPSRLVVMVLGQERIIEFEEVEHGIDFEEGHFDLPEEVQELRS